MALTPADSNAKITCKSCGFLNPAGMRFCGNCGVRLVLGTSLAPRENQVESELMTSVNEIASADLLNRFHQAGIEAAGQRRQVTVLFVDISGYTNLSQRIDGEQLYDLVQKCTRMFANSVYKYDGFVDKFTGDGLMALFGAPIAHENNAELAVRAALDMQHQLSIFSAQFKDQLGEDIKAHIGLHSGHLVVGGVGSNRMMNYTAIGDVVNLASRILNAATAGTILVSDAVYRQVRSLFDFESLPPLQLKGVAGLVAAYRLQAEKSRPGSVRGVEGLYAPMLGRDGELERLQQAVHATLAEKVGRFVAISGDAGVGKSRLVSEFRSFLTSLPVQVLEGFSLIYRKGVADWIFQDLLLHWIDADVSTPQEECQKRLHDLVMDVLPEQVEDVLPYLESLLSLPQSDPRAVRRFGYLTTDQLNQRIFVAVKELIIGASCKKPVVLVLEDLHWADSGSLNLLEYLLDITVDHPVVFVVVSRSFMDARLSAIMRRAIQKLRYRFTNLSLNSLTPDQSDSLLSHLLDVQNMPEDLRNNIVQRAAGIPLYIEEILRMLIDRGYLNRQDDGRWHFSGDVDLETLGVPDTLQGLILTLFDHLDTNPQEMLKVASVIGRDFNRVLVMECLPAMGGTEIDNSLIVLLERGFILPDPSTSGQYMFKHVLVSDTIYSTLLTRERKDLHVRVSESIERLYANNLDEHVDVLARHYFWSDHLDRALKYLILAGQKAIHDYDTTQARKCFEDAISILRDAPHSSQQEFAIRQGMGDVQMLSGEYAEACNSFEEAFHLLGREKNPNAKITCSLQRKIARAYIELGVYERAIVSLEAARQALTNTGEESSPEVAQILDDLGWAYFRKHNLDVAQKYLLQALEMAGKAGRLEVVASVYTRLGTLHEKREDFAEARRYIEKSIAVQEEIGDIQSVARSYTLLGDLCWKQGLFDEASKNFKQSVELQMRFGNQEAVVALNNNLGLLQIDRGSIEEARHYLEEALAQAEKNENSHHVALTNYHISVAYVALEDWQNALKYANRSESLFKTLGERNDLVNVNVSLGIIHLGLNEYADAVRYGEQALQILAELDACSDCEIKGIALRLLGDAALALQDTGKAKKLYNEAETIFVKMRSRLEQGRLFVSMARLASFESNHLLAKTCIQSALDLFVELGAQQDLRKLHMIRSKIVS